LRTFPELRDKTPEGRPGTFSEGEVYKVDTTKAKTELSMSFISWRNVSKIQRRIDQA